MSYVIIDKYLKHNIEIHTIALHCLLFSPHGLDEGFDGCIVDCNDSGVSQWFEGISTVDIAVNYSLST